MIRTAVAYARFSTDLQKETSIEDQAALCEAIAARNGFKIIKVYSDRAKSGASMFERDGLLALMKAAQDRQFEAVITESLSRLSRDQEDTAGIYKRLKFREIQIIDANGEVSDVHVGVGGIVNSMFLTNLAPMRSGAASMAASARASSPERSHMAIASSLAVKESARSTQSRPKSSFEYSKNMPATNRRARSRSI